MQSRISFHFALDLRLRRRGNSAYVLDLFPALLVDVVHGMQLTPGTHNAILKQTQGYPKERTV